MVVLIIVLGVIHAYLFLALTPEQTTEFLLLFAFIPARYDASVMPDIVWPGGWAADVWTFVTYALIHGDLTHLIFNAVWLLAFGSPVARRFGPPAAASALRRRCSRRSRAGAIISVKVRKLVGSVSCCGALKAHNAAGRRRVAATAFRPLAFCAM